MPKASQVKVKSKSAKINSPVKKTGHNNSIWDIFKFGESYTSLILGIIVVVVATIILLTFVRGNNVKTNLSQENQQNVVLVTDKIVKITPEPTVTNVVTVSQPQKPTITPKITIEQKKPSITPKVAKIEPTKKVVQQVNKIVTQKTEQPISGTSYTVKAGDTLWDIAESKYKSGYNWTDIKNANKLSNGDTLAVGQKISLPNVKAKVATVLQSEKSVKQPVSTLSETNVAKITGANYIVVKGDTLWDIAVRAYGDGYQWSNIARVNKLSNPNLIHPGNKLIIPRNK